MKLPYGIEALVRAQECLFLYKLDEVRRYRKLIPDLICFPPEQTQIQLRWQERVCGTCGIIHPDPGDSGKSLKAHFRHMIP